MCNAHHPGTVLRCSCRLYNFYWLKWPMQQGSLSQSATLVGAVAIGSAASLALSSPAAVVVGVVAGIALQAPGVTASHCRSHSQTSVDHLFRPVLSSS